MTLAIGLVLFLMSVAVAVQQVRWAARSGRPIAIGAVSRSLPPGRGRSSDLAIGGLLIAGAFVVEVGRPTWVFYVSAVAAAVICFTVQALAVRAVRRPVDR